MKETFKRKNDIGVDIEYTVLAKFKSDERDYIIYTDFVSDDKDIYRLYVDMVNGDNRVTLSESGKDVILDKFRNEVGSYIAQKTE